MVTKSYNAITECTIKSGTICKIKLGIHIQKMPFYKSQLVVRNDQLLAFCILFQLPLYAVFALGCYGLAMVGYGLMVFPTCPHEADLLKKVKVLS